MSDGRCDFDGEPHTRNWILTRLSPPNTIELCDEHLAPGLVGILAPELGLDFTVLYDDIQRLLTREARKADKALAAAQAAEQQEASDHGPDTPEDQPLPRPPAGMSYTYDEMLVPDDEGGEL